MFVYKFSKNRLFFINEYWIFIPTAILIDILIIKYVKNRRKRKKEMEEQLKKQVRLRRMLALIFASNSSLSVPNGGDLTMQDLEMVLDSTRVPKRLYDCISAYPPGASYLDNNRFRNIIGRQFKSKKLKNEVIYITVSALCRVTQENGVFQWSAPIPLIVKDFGITDLVQTLKKLIGTGFVATSPLLLFLGNGALPYRIFQGLSVLTSGLRIVYWNPEKIATSLL